MGSITLQRNAEKWIEKNEREMLKKYHDLLSGKTIVEFKDDEVDFYVQGKIVLNDGNTFVVHYRWADEDEDALKKEINKNYMRVNEYFQKYVVGKTIDTVSIAVQYNEPHILAYIPETDTYIDISIEEYYDSM